MGSEMCIRDRPEGAVEVPFKLSSAIRHDPARRPHGLEVYDELLCYRVSLLVWDQAQRHVSREGVDDDQDV